jgi:SAM-dependent methyltransferase
VREPRFRKDLYRGTAEHYDRFRLLYPPVLIDDLRARAGLGPASRVLDLACGTGQITFALAPHVGEVVAVDQEPEAVSLGEHKAQRLGVANTRWQAAAAEEVELDGAFDLVAIGNAFHRLDRNTVARRLVPHLTPGGGIALLWGGVPWGDGLDWQQVLRDTQNRWRDTAGAGDRVPEGWQEAIDRDPHEQVLVRAGLAYEGEFEFRIPHRWTVDDLIGFTYSTSFLSQAALGAHAAAFEDDLRARLLACRPDGELEQDLSYAYEYARR